MQPIYSNQTQQHKIELPANELYNRKIYRIHMLANHIHTIHYIFATEQLKDHTVVIV